VAISVYEKDEPRIARESTKRRYANGHIGQRGPGAFAFEPDSPTRGENLNRWIERTGDPGPESPEVYVLETEDQMKSTRNKTAREIYRKNSELYKRWAREGK